MKRTERKHLKTNEFEQVTMQVLEMVGTKQKEATRIAIVVAVIAVIGGGYWFWHQRTQDKAHAMIADAMIVQEARVGPPAEATGGSGGLTFPTERDRAQAAIAKYKAAADAYPSTDAGLFARYQEGSLLVSIGNNADAIKAYQSVIDRAGDALYGQMSKLGLAEAYARAGQYEQAITTFKELAQRKDGSLPIDGILIQLGRTYRDAGKASDAQQTFNRLVEEFPESPFTADARREIEALKKTSKA